MSRYLELQNALLKGRAIAGARWDVRNAQRRRCVVLLERLLEHLHEAYGLTEHQRELVYYSDPHADDPEPGSEHEVFSFDDRHEIRLDVMIEDLEGGRDYGLYILLDIREIEGTRYRIVFEGQEPEDHIVEVDADDPSTFRRFTDEVIGALHTYCDSGACSTSTRGRRSIGFSATAPRDV
ncbi:MAG: hypothetical protein KIT31_16400 [Deltaproteobacteria bacterium]|nr:hypothetical protein [Deltaproteobacteria bacterium]